LFFPFAFLSFCLLPPVVLFLLILYIMGINTLTPLTGLRSFPSLSRNTYVGAARGNRDVLSIVSSGATGSARLEAADQDRRPSERALNVPRTARRDLLLSHLWINVGEAHRAAKAYPPSGMLGSILYASGDLELLDQALKPLRCLLEGNELS
jgi:hypothetical protein